MKEKVESKFLNVMPHTIIMMVGPTGCGKTTMAKKLVQTFKNIDSDLNVQYISSDAERSNLLGHSTIDKTHGRMMEVSKHAFSVLTAKLEAACSYPISAEIIVLDTTAMSKEFRDEIKAIAKKKHYHLDVILHDYSDQRSYYKYLTEDENTRKVVSSAVKRFKTKVLRELKPREYHNVFKIKEHDMDFQIIMERLSEYRSHFLPDLNYAIIGDIHGCYDEFKELVESLDESLGFILVGDYIDKGPKIIETIEYIHDNLSRFNVVYGNHENFVYKALKGLIKLEDFDQEFLDKYFSSIPILQQNEVAMEQFFKIVEASKHFFRNKDFIVTHAPCEEKYLGKIDTTSFKEQRNLVRLSSEVDVLKDQIKYLYEEADMSYPAHIFGHLAMKKVFKYKNKFCIDTGCVEGNELVALKMWYGRPYIHGVPSKQPKTKDLIDLSIPEKQFDIFQYTPRERGRILWGAKNKINFISGTMCPADKQGETLESLESAIGYYKDAGANRIILEKKYMGSRCNVYLFKDVDRCYSVSRNGHLIRVDLVDEYERLISKFSHLFDGGVELVILDSELTPWRILGEGLIDEHFGVFEVSASHELQKLQSTKYEELMNDLKVRFSETDYKADSNSMKKKDLSSKYGGDHGTFSALMSHDEINLENESLNLAKFSKQLDIYGGHGEPSIKPFNILKLVYENGREQFIDNNIVEYAIVGEDQYMVIDFKEGGTSFEEIIEMAKNFYSRVVGSENEGLVVKPEHSNGQYAPFLKVRNEEYLTLVYGHDYTDSNKYQKLLKRKRISGKLTTSIKEYQIGRKMLQIPYNELTEDNVVYQELFAKMMGLEKKEAELDPRL